MCFAWWDFRAYTLVTICSHTVEQCKFQFVSICCLIDCIIVNFTSLRFCQVCIWTNWLSCYRLSCVKTTRRRGSYAATWWLMNSYTCLTSVGRRSISPIWSTLLVLRYVTSVQWSVINLLMLYIQAMKSWVKMSVILATDWM